MNEFDMNEVVARIVKILNDNGMTAKELTEKLGMNKSTITNWKNNTTKPSIESIVAISRIFNVSVDWLLNGEGEKKAEKNTLKVIEKSLSFNDEKLLMQNYREMTEEQKRRLINHSARMLATEYVSDNKKVSTTSKHIAKNLSEETRNDSVDSAG